MAGGLMQLVATGAQDVYITSNPQITFFKVVYKRHTAFAIESVEQTFSGTVDFGRSATCIVSRNGDLMHKVFLQLELPQVTPTGGVFNWVENIGHVLIDQVSIDVGGQVIDRHYGEWLTIWNELTQTSEKSAGYDAMIGNSSALTANTVDDTVVPATTLYIPFQFWFCRNPGLALPLIALQYHDVKFSIQFRPVAQCYSLTAGTISPAVPSITNASLFVDYIYLDTNERREFAQQQHEYLIEQLQFTGADSFSNSAVKSKLAFNHPCKELVWVVHTQAHEDDNDWCNFTNAAGADTVVDAKLQLNGQDRFSARKGGYFNLVQPFQHHTSIPSTGIYVYSFALNPENHQPSGTVNMSRIDNATLILNTSTSTNAAKLRVYAINYNVFRVISGMGGIAYSN